MVEFDLEEFRICPSSSAGDSPTDCQPSLKPVQKRIFVAGPVPVVWLQSAGELPGKSPLLVALALAHLRGLKKTNRNLALTKTYLDRFSIKRLSSYTGLKRLEEAGLVSVTRNPGQSPRVTLLGWNPCDVTR